MKRPAVAVAVGLVLIGILVAVTVWSAPPKAQAAPEARIGAVIDVGPVMEELAALHKEVTALREAVTDAKGIRGDLKAATENIEALDKRMTELNEMFAKYAKATAPAIRALQPANGWEYRVLRNRSDVAATRLGRGGWELVVASQDWLLFKRPIPDAAGEGARD